MANMEDRIDSFIAENGLDENAKDAVIELVNGCFTDYISHMATEWLKNPVDNKSKKNITKSKKAKLEDPTVAEAIDDLMNCTTAILTEYCKNNNLKVGGTKTDLSGRVWRHIQGESSDEDTKKSSKDSKNSKSKKEVHSCFACNSKGAPCGLSATEEYSGHWFCFHHIDNAEELVAAKKPVESEQESTTKSTKTPKTTKTTKTPKTPKSKKSKKSSGTDSSDHEESELNSE
jgi:hypothetical protein